MKKLAALAVVAATALTATATAASAQPYGYGRHAWEPVDYRLAHIERRIERGVMRGTITRAEARRLHIELDRLARLEARYRFNGLSYAERADLDRRFDRLAAMVRFENRDRDRDYGYGYGYGYDRYGYGR
jgi:opacity protein-like surface antigen